jgi:hypothetical protein
LIRRLWMLVSDQSATSSGKSARFSKLPML